MKTTFFNITNNEDGINLVLEASESQHQNGNYEVMLIENPKSPTPEKQRTFMRISDIGEAIQICMAVNGHVPHGDSTVPGFPQSVYH